MYASEMTQLTQGPAGLSSVLGIHLVAPVHPDAFRHVPKQQNIKNVIRFVCKAELCSSNAASSLAAKGTALSAPFGFVLKYLEHPQSKH